MQAPSGARHALNQSDAFDATTLKKLEEFLLSLSPKDEVLNEKLARHLLNPIFNASIWSIDKLDRN